MRDWLDWRVEYSIDTSIYTLYVCMSWLIIIDCPSNPCTYSCTVDKAIMAELTAPFS